MRARLTFEGLVGSQLEAVHARFEYFGLPLQEIDIYPAGPCPAALDTPATTVSIFFCPVDPTSEYYGVPLGTNWPGFHRWTTEGWARRPRASAVEVARNGAWHRNPAPLSGAWHRAPGHRSERWCHTPFPGGA